MNFINYYILRLVYFRTIYSAGKLLGRNGMQQKRHVVIGASAAGIGAVNRLARLAPDDQIICISGESDAPYNTCLLADYGVGQKSEQELSIFNSERVLSSVKMKLGIWVDKIVPDKKQVVLADGECISYDTLFIGTGSSAIIPNIPGIRDCAGVFTFHTLDDCKKVLEYVEKNRVKRAVVIGAGLTGLETADMLLAHDIAVSVVEKQERVLQQLIPEQGSQFIERYLRAVGVQFYPNSTVVNIAEQDKRIMGVELAEGAFLFADLIIVAVGAKRNDQLARDAGIMIGSNGIMTDQYMRTSIEGIWAGGDVAQVTCVFTQKPVTSCTWSDAMLQGLIAAHAMTGNPKIYGGANRIVDSAFFGLYFQAAGEPNRSLAGEQEQATHIKMSEEEICILASEHNKPVGYFRCGVQELSPELKRAKQILLSGEALVDDTLVS